ncbi:MAG: signal peptidase II [Pseudomonadota bacterium]
MTSQRPSQAAALKTPTPQLSLRLFGWLGFASFVVALDQITKFIVVSELALWDRVQVLPFFAWVRYHNPGAAFNFLANSGGWQRWFFVCLALGFSAYLIWELSRLAKHEKVLGWVFSLILGGAIGNMLDRWINGYVVDFILVHYQVHEFPAFNIADSALFCGAALWILTMLIEYRAEKAQIQRRGELDERDKTEIER